MFQEVVDKLEQKAQDIRARTVQMAHDAPSSHVASALSCVDILVVLFFEFMGKEDRFILSKGHGCMSYYAVLADLGFFPEDWLYGYAKNGSKLSEHPPAHGVPGIEVATGSLGHGLSLSVGAALSRKIKGKAGYEIVLLGDGECNEGSVWEAAMIASNLNLDNLIAVVDYNKMQSAGFVDKTSLVKKWEAFGWEACLINGHNIETLMFAFDFLSKKNKPVVLIANTVKGKGVSFMENDLLWHYKPPSDKELELALKEIENNA